MKSNKKSRHLFKEALKGLSHRDKAQKNRQFLKKIENKDDFSMQTKQKLKGVDIIGHQQ